MKQIAERFARARNMAQANREDGDELPTETVWRQAQSLVTQAIASLWRFNGASAPLPLITASPDGMVDLVWISGSRRLIVSILGDPVDVATYTGRDSRDPIASTQGEINVSAATTNEFLLNWLLA